MKNLIRSQNKLCTRKCQRNVFVNIPISWESGQKSHETNFRIAYPYRAIFIPKLTSSAINGLFPLCCKYKYHCIDYGDKKCEVAEKNTAEVKDEEDVFEEIF